MGIRIIAYWGAVIIGSISAWSLPLLPYLGVQIAIVMALIIGTYDENN